MDKQKLIHLIGYVTGKNIPELADEYGYPPSSFYRVISGRVKKSPIRKIISDLVDKPIDQLWPDN
ncbi:hypothetical protein [Desulfotalea psychrophila]|uniref:hypothetical protein n=1 Tax=Desulfotalea psychrophila TaxID=84980 RepID=UPI0012E9EAD9|nr:hypothetical protein [Desulfotalea psychrophila]